mgnify:CR=1 FL=1
MGKEKICGDMKRIEGGSYYTYLTEGCRLCRRGAKLVLFVTGLCKRKCYYCPISEEKKGKDVIFANEREVRDIDDVVDEALSMDAEGVAITGGEPLLKLERVLEFVEMFSKADMHVHLYTSVKAKESVLKKLAEKGLHEIRFHPPELKGIKEYEEPLKKAIKFSIEAGFEIPAVEYKEEIVEIVNRNDAFLNVNELEFSSTNFSNLIKRGWEVGEGYEAKGSKEIADKYAEKVRKFHFCSVRFKDVAQLRRRLIRMAFNMPDFYKVTKDGTVICGLIEGDKELIRKVLIQNGVEFQEVEEGFEVPVDVAESLKNEFMVSIIERYPTSKRIIVEKIPLE